MTQRERHRRQMLWMIRLWMRHHGAWFVFALLFSAASAGTVFAAETTLVSKEVTPAPKASQSQVTPAEEIAPVQVEKKKKRPVKLPDLSDEDAEAEGTMKDEEGTISARNLYGMAVETRVDAKKGISEEIWVTFHKKLKLSGFKSLSDLGEGDKVRMRYKVTKDTKKILLSEIKLLKKKPKENPAVLTTDEEKGAP